MEGVDTNVESYSIEDLFEILSLEPDSSAEQIHNNANTIIARMTSEGKPDMALFLENVKNRLLKEPSGKDGESDSDNDSTSQSDADVNGDDGEGNESREEEEQESSKERKDDVGKKEGNTDEDLVNSFFNQERTKNITQVISFDTRFRPNYYGTTSTSFTIDLPEVQKKVVSMHCLETEN